VTQKKAQIQRQTLEKETAIAEMQKEVVKADQGVQIAERVADAAVKKATGDAQSVKIAAEANAEAIKVNANAEASKTTVMGVAIGGAILVKGQSEAEAYRLAVDAMGKENFTAFKVTEEIGKNHIKIMPDLLINGGGSGGGNGSIDGLLGLQVLEMMGTKMKPLSTGVTDVSEVKPDTEK
jgi:regulator of protease activity HflC (stomatin/prohibitin superfamily)